MWLLSKLYYVKFGVSSLFFSKVNLRKTLGVGGGGGRLPFGKGRVKVNGFRIFIRFPDCDN